MSVTRKEHKVFHKILTKSKFKKKKWIEELYHTRPMILYEAFFKKCTVAELGLKNQNEATFDRFSGRGCGR